MTGQNLPMSGSHPDKICLPEPEPEPEPEPSLCQTSAPPSGALAQSVTDPTKNLEVIPLGEAALLRSSLKAPPQRARNGVVKFNETTGLYEYESEAK